MLATQPTLPRSRRIQGLLNKAVRDPRRVLRDRRTRKPRFCLPFFDLCDALAYEQPKRAAQVAAAAVDLGQRSGDRHLINRSLGVEINALIALAQWQRAAEALERHEKAAAGCCASCLADHLHRRADLALEYRKTSDALLYLAEAWPVIAAGPSAVELGRLRCQRAMGRHFRGEHGAAIDDAGTSLLTMPLDGPRLFFRENIGLIACFLAGGDRRLDELALGYLLAFKQRLKGAVGWQVVHTRLRWVEGIVLARLGDEATAAARLESARNGLRKELATPRVGGSRIGLAGSAAPAVAPPSTAADVPLESPNYTDTETREMVALITDLSQLSTQRRESRAMVSMLYTAQSTLTVDRRLGQTLDETYKLVRVSPESALEYLEDLRTSVRVSVPGLLAERYLTQSRGRSKSRRRPSASPFSFSAAASLG